MAFYSLIKDFLVINTEKLPLWIFVWRESLETPLKLIQMPPEEPNLNVNVLADCTIIYISQKL